MSTARELYKFLEKEYKKGDMIYSQGRDAPLRIYDYLYVKEKYKIKKKLIENNCIKLKEIKDGKGIYIKFRKK